MMLQRLIEKMDRGDYFFVVVPKNEYNTTGRHELHNIDSEEPILIGFWKILRALSLDWFFKKFMY